MSKARPTLLIFAPTAAGGLAEHVYYQGRALTEAGVSVECLAARDFLNGRPCIFPVHRHLRGPATQRGSRLWRRIAAATNLLLDQLHFAWVVARQRPDLVLLDSYVEYLAPLWVWPHVVLGRFLGLHYVANLHDPVRSHQIGPAWWHRWSVRLAYLPLRTVLIHHAPAQPSPIPARLRVLPVPVGVYDLLPAQRSRAELHRTWNVIPGSQVFLAFGYVRDGKNLDLAIRALAKVAGVHLVIAGSVASSADRPFAFYRSLATELGVADRVTLLEGFVSDQDLADYFSATDFALLTYSARFHSQSGVLNVAARARKPVLASSAPSPLLESVRRFQLGVAIPPDDGDAVVDGLRTLLATPPMPDWSGYEAAASWQANARAITALLSTQPRLPTPP